MRLGLFILVHTFMTMNASKNAVLVQNTVSTLKLFGRQVFIKRDDLQFKHNEGLSGNKGRKFRSLLTSDEQHTHILSYGGYQSNAMLALSQIATIRKCSLHYFTQTIPAHLKEEPIGNHLQAIKLGTKVSVELRVDASSCSPHAYFISITRLWKSITRLTTQFEGGVKLALIWWTSGVYLGPLCLAQ